MMAPGSAFYSGAFTPAKRTNPLDYSDYELDDAFKPTGSVTQPERSLTGGATAPDPGAGAHPFSPPGTSGMPGSGTSNPGVINDPYAPMLKHLSDASDRLESAYSAPHAGTARQIFGAILSRRNPGLGGLVSGETQRNRAIEQATQDYGIASSQLAAARAQQNQLVENRLKGAQADEATAKGAQATAEAAAIPAKTNLEQSQARAANIKENPATGELIDITTGKPVAENSPNAMYPLSPDEAKAVGRQPGEMVPLKVKSAANEMSMRGTDPSRVEMNSWLTQNPGKTPADFMKYKASLVPNINFSLQNGGAGGGQGNQPSPLAKGLADGSLKWNDVVSPRTPISVKAQILKEVKGINPNFNSGDFDVEKAVREKYTSGNVSDQLLAIGTAREHMKIFSQLADALDNNDVQALNRIGNSIGVQFGSDKATNFRIASQAFGGEVGKAFDGAGVVAGEREQAQKNFNDAMSKGQFRGAIQTVDKLLAGKQAAAKKAYDAGRQGQPNFGEGASTGGAAPAANPKDPLGIL